MNSWEGPQVCVCASPSVKLVASTASSCCHLSLVPVFTTLSFKTPHRYQGAQMSPLTVCSAQTHAFLTETKFKHTLRRPVNFLKEARCPLLPAWRDTSSQDSGAGRLPACRPWSGRERRKNRGWHRTEFTGSHTAQTEPVPCQVALAHRGPPLLLCPPISRATPQCVSLSHKGSCGSTADASIARQPLGHHARNRFFQTRNPTARKLLLTSVSTLGDLFAVRAVLQLFPTCSLVKACC